MKKLIVLVGLIALAVGIGIALHRRGAFDDLRAEFERRYYVAEIRAAAAENGLDPLFLAAMIHVESRFRPDAVSSAGALGLMQLMPATAREVAREMRISLPETAAIMVPEVNIRLGARYFQKLRRDFGDTRIAIAAYNGGPASVRQWLERTAPGDTDPANFEKGETRRYIPAVEETYRRLERARSVWRFIRDLV
jgi:soluble lytic murein transglycosylase